MSTCTLPLDRGSICRAYYTYAVLWHDGQRSEDYAILGRLDDMGYRPSPLWAPSREELERDDPIALWYYDRLVITRQGRSAWEREHGDAAAL